MPAEPRTVSQVVDFWVTNTEQMLVPAADAMPEARFSFAPSNGEFSGVRTFAEQVKHLAAANRQSKTSLGEGRRWCFVENPPRRRRGQE